MKTNTVIYAKKINKIWTITASKGINVELYLMKLVANSAKNSLCLN